MEDDSTLSDFVPVEFGVSGFSRLNGVSYYLLLEKLNASGVNLLHVPDLCSKRFSWYVSMPGRIDVSHSSYHKDALFLCHEEMAEELLEAFPSCFCVVITDKDCTPKWAVEKNRRNRVVVFKGARRFYYYDSLLQALFVSNLMWENEMDRIVYNRGKLDRLIAVSEKMLGNFVCITDTGFNLIAYSRSIEPPDSCGGGLFTGSLATIAMTRKP